MNQTHSYKKLSVLGTTVFCLALLGGCATTDAVTKAQATADQALQKADQAQATANAAKATADQASQKADNANAVASEAKSTADAAKSESAATSEKLDRMFKKTMQK